MHIYNIKLAIKKFKKYKSLVFINVLGLSIAMAFCIIIMLYLQNELSYDKRQNDDDRLFRITSIFDFSGSVKHMATTPGNAGKDFKETIPEIESYMRVFGVISPYGFIVEYNGDKIEDNKIIYADNNFFDFMPYDFVFGNVENALLGINNVVITKSVSTKLYGDTNPVGQEIKFLEIGLDQIFIISAVVDDQKSNSHLSFNYLLPIEILQPDSGERFDNWLRFPLLTYISLQKNASENELSLKMQTTFRDIAGEYADKWGAKVDFELQAVPDIHLKSNLAYEFETNGDITYVYYFSIIGLLILLVAIINFINLVTAHSYSRSHEIGLRKVCGGNRKQIIMQFLSESMLTAFISLLISVCIVILLLPAYNQLTGHHFTEVDILQKDILIGMLLMWLVSGVGAGLYPALILSSRQPITNLNAEFSGGIKKNRFVKALVIFQFAISIALISSTIVIVKQVNYLKGVKMSFNPEQTLIVKTKTRNVRANSENIKSELLTNPNINSACFSYTHPGMTANFDNAFFLDDKNENATVILRNQYVDFDYVDFYGLKIVEGRNFNSSLSSDSTKSFIINETAARLLDISGNAVGKRLNNASRGSDGIIIGVIKDFHQESLRNDLVPLIYMITSKGGPFLALKIDTRNTAQTLEWIEQMWSDLEPNRNMEYYFMDDYYDRLYKNEKSMGSIFMIFSIIIIIIASMGLFGLVSFIIFQRTKEIGIRRVNGAKTYQVVSMLNRGFAKWVAIAFVIACPVAWYAMSKWLENFAYRTELNWWIFVLAGLIAMGIALLTVSLQSWRAATRNPVESLRYE
jgi:putative ABC transport system permease protein